MTLEQWFDKLSRIADMPNVHNLFSRTTEEGLVRLSNLKRYFELMKPYGYKTLLVSEAPGYQGTYRTGVSFCSEYIMMGPRNKHGLFGGSSNGFTRVYESDHLWKEPSATIVQRTLDELEIPPLIWATFPLHPYQAGKELSNRAPNAAEVALGAELLKDLIEIIQPQRIIAVGNVAQACLEGMGIHTDKVRHPSHGGATQFAEGLRELLV